MITKEQTMSNDVTKAELIEALDRMVNWVAFHLVSKEDEKHWSDIGKARAILSRAKESAKEAA